VAAEWLDHVGSGLGETWREGEIEGSEVGSRSGGARAIQDGGIGSIVVTSGWEGDREHIVT
jgi:hypothetical protein